MSIRVAINGFGRIGRQVLRTIAQQEDGIEVVVVNSVRATPELSGHLFKYDSILGRFPGTVETDEDNLIVDGKPIRVTSQADPLLCPWHAFDVDIVIESTGRFTSRDAAAHHLRSGASKVIVTAPARYADATIVLGVNEGSYDPVCHHVISAASCTTNCLAPVLAVLHENFGVSSGLVTTIHSFTRDQELLDGANSDLRRARAATLNMCPTKTGAAKAIDRVLPALAGRLVGLAVRVPLPDVSLVDLNVSLENPASVEQVNDMFRAESRGPMGKVLDATDEPLVSSDFQGNQHSAIIDLQSTRRADGGLLKVLAWYDNEAGYAARVVDLVGLVGGGLEGRAPAALTLASG